MSQAGAITRAIRGNVTSMVLFVNRNQKMLTQIAEEIAEEVSPETFFAVLPRCFYPSAGQGTHPFA